jgi:hypothetical protein
MLNPRPTLLLIVVAAGDTVTLALVTLYGFASHDLLGSPGSRLLSTFGPLLLSWLLVSPHLGAFDLQRAAQPSELWRPFWAMVLAGPLAAFLRGLILDAPIIPVFVIVLGGISALALLAWRSLFLLILRKQRNNYG